MNAHVCRYAPSTSGDAHPGTLLAALLAWLDARQQQARFILRLENLDPDRSKPAYEEQMLAALTWLGIDWDELEYQSEQQHRYEAAMDALAALGCLYACTCTRKEIKAHGQQAVDGSWRYPGTCRHKRLSKQEWRENDAAIRVALADKNISIIDESGADLSQNPFQEMGDPIVRRKDGSFAYQLVVVVDDAAQGVNRVIRGRDLMPSTAMQIALQEMLHYPRPVYRHHLLLLEENDKKLAKYHKSIAWDIIKQHYTAEAFIGVLSQGLNLGVQGAAINPGDLINSFSWDALATDDRPLLWKDNALCWGHDA